MVVEPGSHGLAPRVVRRRQLEVHGGDVTGRSSQPVACPPVSARGSSGLIASPRTGGPLVRAGAAEAVAAAGPVTAVRLLAAAVDGRRGGHRRGGGRRRYGRGGRRRGRRGRAVWARLRQGARERGAGGHGSRAALPAPTDGPLSAGRAIVPAGRDDQSEDGQRQGRGHGDDGHPQPLRALLAVVGRSRHGSPRPPSPWARARARRAPAAGARRWGSSPRRSRTSTADPNGWQPLGGCLTGRRMPSAVRRLPPAGRRRALGPATVVALPPGRVRIAHPSPIPSRAGAQPAAPRHSKRPEH
jgi:hypothetical protein